MKTCANSHKCIVSTHTEAPHTHGWASGEHKKNTDSIHEIGGERSEHLLDLSICIHFSSIILCKSFFGCASYISIRLIWKWADKREIRDSCDGYTGSSSIPLDSRVGQDYATWKLHKITNENFSWWKYVCHNENEIGYKFKQLVGTIKYNWKILGRFLGNHSFD